MYTPHLNYGFISSHLCFHISFLTPLIIGYPTLSLYPLQMILLVYISLCTSEQIKFFINVTQICAYIFLLEMFIEPKPFTDVSIVMRTAGHSQISRIK